MENLAERIKKSFEDLKEDNLSSDQLNSILVLNSLFRHTARSISDVVQITVSLLPEYKMDIGLFPMPVGKTDYPIDMIDIGPEEIRSIMDGREPTHNGRLVLPLIGNHDMHQKVLGELPEKEEIILGAILIDPAPVTEQEMNFLRRYAANAAQGIQHAINNAHTRVHHQRYKTAMGEFRHDVGNTLMALSGFGHLVSTLADRIGAHALCDLGESVHTTVKGAENMIQTTFNDKTIEAGLLIKPTPADLYQDIVQPALDQTSYVFLRYNLKLSDAVEKKFEGIRILADNSALRTAFRNVWSNLKYATPGSVVDVSVRESGRYYDISIINETPYPVSEEEQGRLFEAKYRPENKQIIGTGTGMGLVKDIVEAHNGQVSVAFQDAGDKHYFTLTLSFLRPE